VPSLLPVLEQFAFAAALALGIQSGPSAHDELLQARQARLEVERRELVAQVRDRRWMQDQGRATLVRLAAERGWKKCAENEAAALAKTSRKPAKLVAEAALGGCQEWEQLLTLALANGAYPYLSGYPSSREDIVALAELESREAALSRVLMWRAGSIEDDADQARTDAIRSEPDPPAVRPAETTVAAAGAPPEPLPETLPPPEEQEIVVVASRRGGCRVRLADRTLSDRELEANAKAWAASRTPLRVIKPAGADYGCMACGCSISSTRTPGSRDVPTEAMASEEKPFAVIYRWSVDAEHEDHFRRRWHAATLRLRDEFGGLGSCLTRAENGDFVAFARWPNEAAREQAFARAGPVEPSRGILSFEETRLWVEDDLLSAKSG
jgi:Antibiotic biosynthesis monooxygenase